MNRRELEAILPHRDGMLLLDEAFVENETARGVYTVRGDEFFLQGHFPGNPVVPGVILCEILAQSVCVLFSGGLGENTTPYYTGMNSVRFKKPVKPGDKIETECVVTNIKPPFYFAKGKAAVDGKICVQAEFSFAVIGGKND